MKEYWERWKKFAEKLGNFQASLLFSIFFFLIVTPFGLVARFFTDYFGRKAGPSWHKMEKNTSSLVKMREQ